MLTYTVSATFMPLYRNLWAAHGYLSLDYLYKHHVSCQFQQFFGALPIYIFIVQFAQKEATTKYRTKKFPHCCCKHMRNFKCLHAVVQHLWQYPGIYVAHFLMFACTRAPSNSCDSHFLNTMYTQMTLQN